MIIQKQKIFPTCFFASLRLCAFAFKRSLQPYQANLNAKTTLFLFFVMLLLCACSSERDSHSQRSQELQQWKSQNGKVKVLSTIAMINDIVARIGDGHVDTIALVRGELDPHSYQLVKGDDEKFHIADVIFYNGLGLEHGSSLQRYLHDNPKAIPLGDLLKKQFPDRIILIQDQLDPHIWMDISLWKEIVPIVVQVLSQRDPQHEKEFHDNGSTLMREMEETDYAIHNELQAIPPNKRYLVTSHDAFNYFARAYLATPDERINGEWRTRFAAPEGLAPESQLSTYDIQSILGFVKNYRINTLFPESNISQDSIRKIVNAGKEQGCQIIIASEPLYGDAMGKPGSGQDSYLSMMRHNAKVISFYLKKE